MALYPPAVKKLIPLDKAKDPPIKARLVILHVDAGNANTLAPYFTSGSGGVESHFFVKKDGTVEQYRDTFFQADANMDANGFAISIETQGYAAGEWTPAQLDAIKALLLWCHTTHGIPLTVPKTWDGSGVGYHILFMQAWAGGPRACPGPDRIKQFQNVLVPWMASSTKTAPKEFEVADADDAKVLWTTPLTTKGTLAKLTEGESAIAILSRIGRNLEALIALERAEASAATVAAAVVAALPQGQTATAHDIAAEIIAQLTPKETA